MNNSDLQIRVSTQVWEEVYSRVQEQINAQRSNKMCSGIFIQLRSFQWNLEFEQMRRQVYDQCQIL